MSTLLATNTDVVNYIKVKLGHPVINIELTDAQIDFCIADTINLFNRYLTCIKTSVVYEIDSTTQVTLGDDVNGILYLNYIQPYYLQSYDQLNIFDLISRMVYPAALNVEEWYTYKTYYKMFQKVRGSEPQWFYYNDTKTLVLDANGGPWDVFYIATADVTLTSVLKDSKRRYVNDFLYACLGYAKMNMSLIRRKFGSIPAPGGTLTSDGDALFAEGEKLVTDVETKLKRINDTNILPVIG